MYQHVTNSFYAVYAAVKHNICESNSIKISAAALPRDKCWTEITVAADFVPKVQYISLRLCRHAKTMYPLSRHRMDLLATKWILYKRTNLIALTYFKDIGIEIPKTSVTIVTIATTIYVYLERKREEKNACKV